MESNPMDVVRAAFAEAFDASGGVVNALSEIAGPTLRSLIAFHMDRLDNENHGGLSSFEAADIITDAHAAIASHAKAALQHSAIPQGAAARGELSLGVARVEATCQAVIAVMAEAVGAIFKERRDQLTVVQTRRDFVNATRRSPHKSQAPLPTRSQTDPSIFVSPVASGAHTSERQPPAPETPLAVLGTVASSRYSLKATQEYIVSKETPKPKWSDVPSKVAEVIRPTTAAQREQQQQQQAASGSAASAARSINNPFSTAALDKRLQNVVASIGTMAFESAWDAVDKDATVTDRRIATPTKDSRTMKLLRNLSPERRDYILYQSALNKLPMNSRPSSGSSLNNNPHMSSSEVAGTAPSAVMAAADRRMIREADNIPSAMSDFSSAPRVATMKALAGTDQHQAQAQASESSGKKWSGTAPPSRSRPHTATTHNRQPNVAHHEASRSTADHQAGGQPQGTFAQHIANVRRSRPASAAVAPTVSALVDSIRGGSGVTLAVTSVKPTPTKNM